MKKIMNLQKERIRRSISESLSYNNKISLNINLDNGKFFTKATKEISKKIFFKKIIEEENNELLIKYIQNMLQHFNIQVEYIDNDNELIELIGRVQLKYTTNADNEHTPIKSYTKELIPIKCIVKDSDNKQFEFYSLLRARIGDKAENYLFKNNKESIKIVDFCSIISQLYLINETINYFNSNEQICIDALTKLSLQTNYYKSFLSYTHMIIAEKNKALLKLENTFQFSKYGTALLTGYTKEIIGALFKEMAFDNQDIVIQEQQLSEMNSDYAKSYENKKNINKETIEAMKKSIFNNFFQEVELDNDTDLEKIKQIENEFSDSINYLCPSANIINFMKNVTLRFRYLGHRKAAGLYFPSYKTICIDLRDPSSFLHEFMHMVDYQDYSTNNYKLSSQYNYRKIIKRYIEVLDTAVEELPNNNGFKKEYNGKNKFNRNYYCNSAEIFARCGEIYFKRVLKIDNSLIKDFTEENIIYPKDKELEEMIKNYYSSLFSIEKNVKVSASASNPNILLKNVDHKNTIKTTSDIGQISFIF